MRLPAFTLWILPLCFASACLAAASVADDDWLYRPAPSAPEPRQIIDQSSPPVARSENVIQNVRVVDGVPVSVRSERAWTDQADYLRAWLEQDGFELGDSIFIRIFKQPAVLQVFVETADGYRKFRSYGICNLSGGLGPKRLEGDLQAPEGFYSVTTDRLHPTSNFHLAFNLGFPNAYDADWQRTGSNIMIHGGCASRGCFAMTDYYMEQIYVLAEAALRGGQQRIPVHIFPFRPTVDQLRQHADSRWIEFWRGLRPAYEYFEDHGYPPRVSSRDGIYRFTETADPARPADNTHAAASSAEPVSGAP